MSDTLYLQLDQNIEVTNPHVYLQDIAALSMSDPKILNRLRVMPVIVLDAKKPGRYVMSISDLLKKIQKLEPSIDISPIGETDFIITCRISSASLSGFSVSSSAGRRSITFAEARQGFNFASEVMRTRLHRSQNFPWIA